MPAEDKHSAEVRPGVERLVGLTDDVFAFAVTLLVLDLVVPVLPPGATSEDLLAALSGEWTIFFDYLISFLIAGAWWSGHHRTFENIRSSDSALRWLNLIFLLWIALLPFITKVLSSYYSLQLAVVLYACDQAAAGFFITVIWWYASRNHRLVDKSLRDSAIRSSLFKDASVTLWFVLSIFVSFVDLGITPLMWLGIFPIHGIAGRNKPSH